MKARFSVTYDLIDDESAEAGDTCESGFISRNVCLRDAIADFFTTDEAGSDVQSIEAADSDIESTRWFAVYNSMSYDGRYENRALHLPDSVSGPSRRRIARLIGVRQ